MRPHGTPSELHARRREAVRLVLDEGLTRTEAGRRLGVHRESVGDWVRLYQRGGDAALQVRPPGEPCRLTDGQVKDVVACVLQGPKAHGFDTELWTLARIARLIEQRHGVTYHRGHLSKLADAWGLSHQKPAKRAVERDEAKIAAWLKRDWPRIKKKRSG